MEHALQEVPLLQSLPLLSQTALLESSSLLRASLSNVCLHTYSCWPHGAYGLDLWVATNGYVNSESFIVNCSFP